MIQVTACTEWDAATDAAMDGVGGLPEQAAWVARQEAEAKAAAEYHSAIAAARAQREGHDGR